MRRHLQPVLRLGMLALSAAALARAAAPNVSPLAAADLQFFESRVRPVLADKCYKCHSHQSEKVKGGLLLDTREGLLQGGNTGPAVVAGKPGDSLLIQAVRYADPELQMPPKGEKLSDQEIADLTEWVRRGAPDPRTTVAAKGGAKPYGGVGKNHWAFKPVQKPAVPEVRNAAWVRNPVDSFVLAKLEANGMAPNTPAEKAVLMRRLYFDLIGLPPHPADVQAFVRDTSPDAYTKVVDRLLGSQQYGEHWARYWLDVVRYSDTKGDAKGQEDNRFPHAWTYRDWVINALNADLPYNQFIISQLAGDALQRVREKNAKGKEESGVDNRWPLAAMGFLTLGNQFNGRKDDIIGDQIDVTTKAFLGLTVACARCHDHKFDPISIKDYYSLYGVFANADRPATLPTLEAKLPKTSDYFDYLEKAAALEKREAELKAQRDEFQRALRAAKNKPAAKVDPRTRQTLQRMERELQRDKATLEAEHPGAPARANVVQDVARPRDYPVLLRGEAANKGEVVPRRFLEILSPDPKRRQEWKEGSGRVQLAQAIADPKNPLTARVLVNRLWQQHWGAGFVETPDDLGNMSSPPSHPELLDWLAATFVENNWSMKSIHRLIVLSAAYQQSSLNNPAFAERDPNNRLLWRYNVRRMDFEELHDSLLAIAGELDRTYGGRPVAISSQGFAKRRSVYAMIDRTNPPELLTQFDFPSPDVATGRRYETLVPQQALFLMNSPMVIETARKLVDRPAFAELKSDEERVVLLYLAIFQRWPTRQEVDLGIGYVKSNPAGTAVALSANLTPKEQSAKEQRIATKKAQSAKQKGKFNTQVGGVYDNQTPLDAWTKLAHALFQSNEATFYN